MRRTVATSFVLKELDQSCSNFLSSTSIAAVFTGSGAGAAFLLVVNEEFVSPLGLQAADAKATTATANASAIDNAFVFI
jgi:hypothetical protein